MFLLSPRFLALPLIALTVILALPRPDASNAQAVAARQPAVEKAVTCSATPAPASCVVATSNNFMVR